VSLLLLLKNSTAPSAPAKVAQASRAQRRTVPVVRKIRVAAPSPSLVAPRVPIAATSAPQRKWPKMFRRRTISVPVITQTAPVPPVYVPVSIPRKSLRTLLRRGSTSMARPQAAPAFVTPRRRLWPFPKRGRVAVPVPIQAVVAPPTFVPQNPPMRLLRMWLKRGAVGTPVPVQVAVPPPAFVPQNPPKRGLRTMFRRNRGGNPPRPQASPLPVNRTAPRNRPTVHTRVAGPPIPQATPPAAPAFVPGQTRVRRFARTLAKIRSANPFGGTGAPPPPTPTGYLVELWNYVDETRMWRTRVGYTAYRIAGVWHFEHTPDDSQLAGADLVLRGGYNNVVDVATGLELASYGVTVTPIF